MHESPDFHRQRAEGTVPLNPLKHIFTHHRAGVARSFAISALGSITYYVGITYVPAFLTTAGKQSEAESLWLSTGAAVLVILVTPFIGSLSDRLGFGTGSDDRRRRALCAPRVPDDAGNKADSGRSEANGYKGPAMNRCAINSWYYYPDEVGTG
jgi:hypothetical protein